jgi:hypothetical protein
MDHINNRDCMAYVRKLGPQQKNVDVIVLDSAIIYPGLRHSKFGGRRRSDLLIPVDWLFHAE